MCCICSRVVVSIKYCLNLFCVTLLLSENINCFPNIVFSAVMSRSNGFYSCMTIRFVSTLYYLIDL